MLKASALYIVIIIALVIALLCSSLIVAAYFYREQEQQASRYARLQTNLESGINVLLAGEDSDLLQERSFSLFDNEADSVALKQIYWGVFDIGIARAFEQKDTISKIFSFAYSIDSAKWAALYLVDEDRPVSVSGKTAIKGDAYISKAGIKEAYVDGKSYEGEKKLVSGKIYNSGKTLPQLNSERLNLLEQYFTEINGDSAILNHDSVINSFFKSTHTGNFRKKVKTLSNIKIEGNIVLHSDTTLIIDNSAQLNNVLVFAPVIIVKAGFRGTCQLFATDSVSIQNDCLFKYPSAIGVLRFDAPVGKIPSKITIGPNTRVEGLLFSYDKTNSTVIRPVIDLGKNTTITGQIYSQGFVGLKDGVVINGSVFTGRFLYQSTSTRYENYIINTTLNSNALSPYYLSSDLAPVSSKKRKVLQWLEIN